MDPNTSASSGNLAQATGRNVDAEEAAMLHNLIEGSQLALILLDSARRVKWYSEAAAAAFDLRAATVGQTIDSIPGMEQDKWLTADAGSTLHTRAAMQAELKSPNGRQYLRRTLPYLASGDKIEGVIVAFADITELRRKSEQQLEDRVALTESLEQRLAERTLQLRAVMFELALAEERDRRSIATDLHDHLGQILSAASLKLAGMMPDLDRPSARKGLQQVSELL